MDTADIDHPAGGTKATLVTLSPGDELHASVIDAAAKHGIEGGVVSAIGAVDDMELGYFSLPENVYMRRRVLERVEVVALSGNLSMKDGKPFLHAHGLFTGRDFAAFGGHVFRAVASIILEVTIIRTGRMERIPYPQFGLTKLIAPGCPAG